MATIAHCDTHTVLWLYAGEIDRLGTRAIEAIETFELMVSPIVRLEMKFLLEIDRINEKPERIFKSLEKDFGVRVCGDPFDAVVESAERIHWTRDPFDRLIVAHAMVAQARLITKDAMIRKNFKNCIW
jgi:PIN domain nuclease of toxin-antitoxin system